MNSEFLFVYGLLRRKANHEMGRLLFKSAEFISAATFQGRLYLIDHYPGAIPSEKRSDSVNGDVFRIHHSSIFSDLDRFEGIGSQFSIPNEYRRAIQEVVLTDGAKIKSWIYLYNWPVQELIPLHSGDFIKEYIV
ncbi:MAG: gamma-glutamylcyclotransferase family protein [Bacteroidota bacterium]